MDLHAASFIGEPDRFPAYLSTNWAIQFCLQALACLRVADHLGDEPRSIEALHPQPGRTGGRQAYRSRW